MLATKHGKQGDVGPALSEVLGITVDVADVDTDLLGTFTGEVPRTRPPLDTAVAKARMGMMATGCSLGLATEGTFRGHPEVPSVTVHTEIAVFVDDTREGAAGRPLTVVEHVTTLETNAGRHTVGTASQLDQALRVMGFPGAGVVVRAAADGEVVAKGVRTRSAASAAVARARSISGGTAVLESDLRAHHNPARRRVIRAAARNLGLRLATPCPRCRTPGFGSIGREPGLRCADCGAPTDETAATLYGCPRCDHRSRRAVDAQTAPPVHCQLCNP